MIRIKLIVIREFTSVVSFHAFHIGHNSIMSKSYMINVFIQSDDFYLRVVFINPRRMRRRVTVVVLCVCLSVYYHKISCLPRLYVANKVLQGSLWCFQRFYRLAFPENALFKSYGVICWSPLPSSLPGEFSTAKRDSDGFFSARKVYMVSYRSNNTTGSSLIVLYWQLQRSFLAISACYKC